MKALRHRRDHAADTGASAVEFALVVTPLVLFLFGIIAFGIVFAQNLALNNAARDAARYGVVRQIDGSPARSCLDTLSHARSNANSLGMGGQAVGVTVTRQGANLCSVAEGSPLTAAQGPFLAKPPCQGSVSGTDDQLVVTATYASGLTIPLWGKSNFDLSGSGYFRCEYS